ncbi:MAG: DUF2971 domain-containing protein [Sciscionella sp.]
MGIAESRRLWASSAAFLNDSSEIVYIKTALEAVAHELETEFEEELPRRFLRLIGPMFEEFVLGGYDVYLACFCEEDDLLSQWRGYPSTGGGYAIGFRSSVIARNRMLRKVVYDEATQRQILGEMLRPACQHLAENADDSHDYIDRALLVGLRYHAAALAECSVCFKHPGFAEEKEWRLVRVNMRQGEAPERVTPSFRESATGLLPYLPLELEREGDEERPIAEVVVGPNTHPDLAARAAAELLGSVGYASPIGLVRQSSIPLRV